MTRFRLPISQQSLHRRAVRLRDTKLDDASMFPFYDSDGTIESVMLVWPASPAITAIELGETSIHIPLLGPIRVDLDSWSLRVVDAERGRALAARRWHHDPWWVLKESRFAGHPAVPSLKASNSANRFSVPISRLYFAADLERATLLLLESGEAKKFHRSLLADRSEKLTENHETANRGWRLSPIWTRSTIERATPQTQEEIK